MRQIQLRNGSYIHPAKVKEFQIRQHMFGGKYYVRALLKGGGTDSLDEKLEHPQAKVIQADYDQQLQGLRAEVPAYDEGYSEGYETGKSAGYSEGHSAGYEAGKVATQQNDWNAAEWNGTEKVLCEIRSELQEIQTELNYAQHLKDERRQSLYDMNNLLDRLLVKFAPAVETQPEDIPEGSTEI